MMDAPVASPSKVTYNGIEYDVATMPAAKAAVVLEQKDDVLGAVKIDKLVHNLSITGELIHLAYCATPAKYGELRAQIDTLHLGFGDIAGECVRELGTIRDASEEVGRQLETAFSLLYAGEEPVALEIISDCAGQAQKLADAAGRLAGKFDALCKIADKALADSEKKLATEITARDQLTAKKNELLAQQRKLTEVQTKLAKLVAELRTEYDEAKGTLSKTEERAFALAITGAIMQPLGQAIGGAATAVALVYSSRGVPPGVMGGGGQPPAAGGGGAANQPSASPDKPKPSAADQKKLDDAKANVDAAELEVKAAEADEKTLEATKAVLQKKLDTLPAKLSDAAERRKQEEAVKSEIGTTERALDNAKTAKDKAEADLKNQQAEYEAVKTAIEKLGVAITDAGKNLSAMGNDYLKIADGQREHVKQLFKVWIEKQDLEREALGQVKEVALRLENMGKQEVSAQVTISALFQVVAAMKQVVAILHEARLFWQNMAKACTELATPTFKSEIEKRMRQIPEKEKRIRLFYNVPSFKVMLLKYLAKWRALEVIAREYIEATKGVRTQVMADFKIMLVGDKAKDKVKQLSQKLLGEVASDIEKLNAETVTVEQALAVVEKNAA